MKFDRRKLERRHLIYYLRVFDQETDQLLGHLVNVSPEGVMLISENPLETEKRFQLCMHFPDKIFGKEGLTIKAQSVWCKRDINPAFYDIGFKIEELAWDDATVLKELIDRFSFSEG